MGTYQDEKTISQQRSFDDRGLQSAEAQRSEALLLRRIRELESEVELARATARRQTEELQAQASALARLREANEHLVLATVNAEHLREDAEAANRRQKEFLAMLAHELRNPLSPISMAATLLERSPDVSPQLQKLSQMIARQVGHMARLLDDLLDAARISSGKITLAVEPLVLNDILRDAAETIQPRIEERQQQLALDLPAAPVVVAGDRVRLTQVFTNLLNNASKYTGDRGRLRVVLQAGAQAATVAVEDNGTGMTPDVIPHIFDLFTQGPRSLARSEGGLGVGLNVVRNLVLMHNGAVWAESAGLGQGSRFTVRLPCSAQQVAPDQAPPPCAPSGRQRVLLVEDNVDACDTLAELMRNEGHQVDVAHDGHAGLAAALAHAYDVILCDIGLPGVDGLNLIRTVRSACGTGPLAVALTGYGQAEDKVRGMAMGFDEYLVKPIEVERLLALVAAGPRAKRAART